MTGALGKEKVIRALAGELDDALTVVSALAGLSEKGTDDPVPAPVTADPDDDYLIALALQTGATRSYAETDTSWPKPGLSRATRGIDPARAFGAPGAIGISAHAAGREQSSIGGRHECGRGGPTSD